MPRSSSAIGTGRIALPLAQRGVRVDGIELSEAMVAQLRASRAATTSRSTIGDFATTRVEGTFRLVYLVFNTIGNLTTQDEQVACFQNAAAHLEPGGAFVIEVGVPRLQRLPPGETFHAVPGERRADRLRRVRRRQPGADLAPLRDPTDGASSRSLDPVPLRRGRPSST